MVGATLQEGDEGTAPYEDGPGKDEKEGGPRRRDFAVGTTVLDCPPDPQKARGPFAELDARLRELDEQLAWLRYRIAKMSER